MFQLPPPEELFAIIIVVFFAIGIHEYAHCKFAELAGDPTPRYYGRVTLNLFKHFELMGTIMMVVTAATGYGIGWGKPAPMDPRKMKNPRLDLFIAVAAGPLSNIAQAVIWAALLRITMSAAPELLQSMFVRALLTIGILTNLAIAFFNLIPFGPLDGHWLVGELLPEKPRYYWYKFNRNVGMIGLFAAILVLDAIRKNGGPDVLWMVIGSPIHWGFRLLTGIGPEA